MVLLEVILPKRYIDNCVFTFLTLDMVIVINHPEIYVKTKGLERTGIKEVPDFFYYRRYFEGIFPISEKCKSIQIIVPCVLEFVKMRYAVPYYACVHRISTVHRTGICI